MRDCLEILGDVIAIHLYEPGALSFSIPFNVSVPRYSDSQVQISSNNISSAGLITHAGIAIDTYYNNIPRGSIIMEPGVSIKETVKTSASGVAYTTKVSVRSYDPIDDIRAYINTFSSISYFDAVIVDSNSNLFVIRGAEPATSISMSASLPVTSLQGLDIEMVSVSGIIPVIQSS